jgi:hypothetical protein
MPEVDIWIVVGGIFKLALKPTPAPYGKYNALLVSIAIFRNSKQNSEKLRGNF